MQTPLQRLLQESPDYAFFKVFGCACWPHIHQYNNHKLHFRSKKGVFLGYISLHKGYKCHHVPSNRVYISRDVVFDEHVYPFANLPGLYHPPVMESSLLSPDKFMDAAYAPSLLANHGAGTSHRARLELLTPEAAPLHEHGGDHVDRPTVSPPLHGVHGSSSGARPMHGVALPSSSSPIPTTIARSQALLVDTSTSSVSPSPDGPAPESPIALSPVPSFDAMVDDDQPVHSPLTPPSSTLTPLNSPSESSSPDSPAASPSLVHPPVVSGPVTRCQRGIIQKKVCTADYCLEYYFGYTSSFHGYY
jgi:hypothetical protein